MLGAQRHLQPDPHQRQQRHAVDDDGAGTIIEVAELRQAVPEVDRVQIVSGDEHPPVFAGGVSDVGEQLLAAQRSDIDVEQWNIQGRDDSRISDLLRNGSTVQVTVQVT